MPLVDSDAFAQLSVRVRFAGPGRGGADAAVLSIEGELDRWTVASPEWREAVAEVAAYATESAYTLVLDLSRLYFLDLAGLAEFESLASLAAAGGGRLALAGTRPRIREFLRQACAEFDGAYADATRIEQIAAQPAPSEASAMAA